MIKRVMVYQLQKLYFFDIKDYYVYKFKNLMTRGKFILFEGLDRSGKTTQTELLLSHLQNNDIPVVLMKFPDRTTQIGQMINMYLTNACELDDHVVHLLFAANRWELAKTLTGYLDQGITVICDRYFYSGIAYSAASQSMDMEWCAQTENGLPEPDIIYFIDLTVKQIMERNGFGEERYERVDYQERVYRNFLDIIIKDNNINNKWNIINGNKTIDALHTLVKSILINYIPINI
jgi:dTMP kinase